MVTKVNKILHHLHNLIEYQATANSQVFQNYVGTLTIAKNYVK